MPLTNLASQHLSDAETETLKSALTALQNATQSLTVNLEPAERSKYGTVNEQNKLLINKVNVYHTSNPEMGSTEVDWEEFSKDFKSRAVLEAAINTLDALRIKLMNAKILHDYDNYQAALEDYSWTAYKAGSTGGAYETKHSELRQFFNRTGAKKGTAGSSQPEAGA